MSIQKNNRPTYIPFLSDPKRPDHSHSNLHRSHDHTFRKASHFPHKLQRKWIRFLGVVTTTVAVSFAGYGIISGVAPGTFNHTSFEKITVPGESNLVLAPALVQTPDWVRKDFLTPNEYSRPQTPLVKVNGVVIHYVGNPGTTAQSNRNYFEQLATTQDAYASSHFVIGLEGEIIQCIPLNEIAYCSNDRNSDTISIECCHPDAEGQFNSMTYDSLVRLTAWLCETYDLDPLTDVIRHYDVTGKICPNYYVEHPDAWEEFRRDAAAAMNVE